MKPYSIWIFLLVLTGSCQERTSTATPVDSQATDDIIQVVTTLFVSTDERNWSRVAGVFTPRVVLDYASMTGKPATILSPTQILQNWRSVLPGFEQTHHQLGNFKVSQNGDQATVFYYGTATHYLPQPDGRNLWTVVGTYDFHLVRKDGNWRADRMAFRFKYQDGNLDLPKRAAERVRKRTPNT